MSAYSSVLHQILVEHGLRLLLRLARRLPDAVWAAVSDGLAKIVTCRTEQSGFIRLACTECGETKVVPFTCKHRLCPSCGWLAAQRTVESVTARLIRSRHRHVVCTVPSELRSLFFQRRDLLRVVCDAAAAATTQVYQRECTTHRLMPGIIAVCHTFGRDLGFHVHAHLLVTVGAVQVGGVWQQPIVIHKGHAFRRAWQYHLLTKLRKALPADDPWQQKIGRLFRSHPTGFVVNYERQYWYPKQALRYCCRYMARPPIGKSRILSYDGKHVVFTYEDFKDGKVKQRRCTVYGFLLILLQHTLPKSARTIHYYGLYRARGWRQRYEQAREASRYPERITGSAPERLSWRERIIRTFSHDPVQCPKCGAPMVVVEVRPPPKKGKAAIAADTMRRAGQLTLDLA